MDWNILPLKGAGSLRFGMSPQRIRALLGEPRVSRQRRAPGAAMPGLKEMYLPALGLTYEQARDDVALVAGTQPAGAPASPTGRFSQLTVPQPFTSQLNLPRPPALNFRS